VNSRNITAATLALVTLVASGCFSRKEKVAAQSTPPTFTIRSGSNTNVVMTPATSPTGRVVRINKEGNFAVISFPIGQLPANGTVFGIYHAGMKSGQIKISGPAQETFTVGDLIAGSGQEGDEVRAE
jgi:hypothetical protein